MKPVLFLSLPFVAAACSAESHQPGPPQPPVSACGPAPVIVPEAGYPWVASLREGGADLARLRANFAVAFADACAKQLNGPAGLPNRKGGTITSFLLLNSPDGNDLAIDNGGDVYPGVDALIVPLYRPGENEVSVPDAEHIGYEIECWVRPATEAEIEESGRCLKD